MKKTILAVCICCLIGAVSSLLIYDRGFRDGELVKARAYEGQFAQMSEAVQASHFRERELLDQLPEPFTNDRYVVVSAHENGSLLLKGSLLGSEAHLYRCPLVVNDEGKSMKEGDVIFYDPGVHLWTVERPSLMIEIVGDSVDSEK